jgi:phospholipid/cholesterol/gamma-HCH transport system substrate-binding protein
MIYGGSMAAQQVADGDLLGVEKALSTDEMLTTLQQNNKNLLEITTDFKTISQRLIKGEGSVGKLLTDETLANNLETTVAGLKQASANAQRLTASISDYASKLQSEGSLTNDLVTDTVIFSRLKTAVAQLQQTTKTATEVANNFKEVSTKVNSSNSPVGVLLNDPQAAADLKATLANLNAGTEKLDENMEALQHNFLLRGFFKKKAKADEKAAKDAAKAQNN